MRIKVFLASFFFTVVAIAAPLKIYDANKVLYYQGTTGAGTSADPYGLAVTITDAMETSANGNTAVKVFIQDQTTPVVDQYLHFELAEATLASAAVVDSRTVTLEPGHGAVAGNFLEMAEGTQTSEFEILSVSVDTLTLDTLIDFAFTTAASVQVSSVNMNVDGSSTPVIFHLDPKAGQMWDIVRIIFVIEDNSQMDFSLFGSLPAVTNGAVLRYKNGTQNNIFTWKSNGELINRCYDGLFQENIGVSIRGFTARCSFAGQDKHGVTIRLDGDAGDELQVIIQDDLSTLTKVRMIAQGHVVQ